MKLLEGPVECLIHGGGTTDVDLADGACKRHQLIMNECFIPSRLLVLRVTESQVEFEVLDLQLLCDCTQFLTQFQSDCLVFTWSSVVQSKLEGRSKVRLGRDKIRV